MVGPSLEGQEVIRKTRREDVTGGNEFSEKDGKQAVLDRVRASPA